MAEKDSITQLYPLPADERPLKGTYLAHHLRQYSQASGRAFVYGNFVVSLDGRIAIPHPTRDGLTVPKVTANDRDWRLYQELAAQADLIISSGRYLRDWADGRAQEILQVDNPEFADLKAWRLAQGLQPHPDIAIISGSLQFPIPDVLTAGGRKVVVFTTANPDPERVREIEAKAGQVFVVGEKSVQGDQMVAQMTELGYTTVYSAAGPQVMHLLLAGGVLDRLYLTHASRLLAGRPFSSIVEGDLFASPVDMKLNNIYFDPHGVAELGQLFMSYDVIR
ncbi:MAG: dihydrofolate reductase family protein [Anaerolineales bacterium]|nr:dihydrofolate reductase family protein [Anaerolineales bacterium]